MSALDRPIHAPGSRLVEPAVEELLEFVRRRAAHYYPHLCGRSFDVRLKSRCRRRNSTLYRVELEGPEFRRALLVKVPFSLGSSRHNRPVGGRPDRPRLYPKSVPQVKSTLEHLAMSRIASHFGQLNDHRLGAVRMLDATPSGSAVVMEQVPAINLNTMLRCPDWLPGPLGGRPLDPVMHHTGRWLSLYHELPPLPHTRDRTACRSDYLEATARFARYLMRHESNGRRFLALRQRIVGAAERILPEWLPLALAHGDFAPRNVLVGPDRRVTVIDTLARWRAPVYEDLAHFVIALKASGPQVASGGWWHQQAVRRQYERQFLQSYFADRAIAWPQIRAFEALLILESWAGVVYRFREARGMRRMAKGFRLAVWRSYMAGYLASVLEDIERGIRQEGG